METLLGTTQSHPPVPWLQLVHQHDPEEHYVVTAVSYYKQKLSWPAFRPEYLTLVIQPYPDQSHPASTPVLIKVARAVRGDSFAARLGLWGPTDDRVTILGPATDIQPQDQQLHHLTWTPEKAPKLEAISCFIACAHYDIPRQCHLKSSCHGFVRAILEAVHDVFDGTPEEQPQPRCLVPNTCILHVISPGSSHAHATALMLSTHAEIFHKQEDTVDEMRQRPSSVVPRSWFTYVVPLDVMRVRTVADVMAKHYRSFRGDGNA